MHGWRLGFGVPQVTIDSARRRTALSSCSMLFVQLRFWVSGELLVGRFR